MRCLRARVLMACVPLLLVYPDLVLPALIAIERCSTALCWCTGLIQVVLLHLAGVM
jgi:hypothetical protein